MSSSTDIEQIHNYYRNIIKLLSTALMKAINSLSRNDAEKLNEAIRDLENICSIVESSELCELLSYLKRLREELKEVPEDFVEKVIKRVKEEILPALLQELNKKKIEFRPIESKIVKINDVALIEFSEDGRITLYIIET